MFGVKGWRGHRKDRIETHILVKTTGMKEVGDGGRALDDADLGRGPEADGRRDVRGLRDDNGQDQREGGGRDRQSIVEGRNLRREGEDADVC